MLESLVIECPACAQSSGYVLVRDASRLPFYSTCLVCNGRGMVPLHDLDLDSCNELGEGGIVDETLTQIPAGVFYGV